MKDALGSVQSVLVLGGGSEIALATVRALVADRTREVILAARDPRGLAEAAQDLRQAGASQVELIEFDANKSEGHEATVERAFSRENDIDLVLLAFGVLGDQDRSIADSSEALRVTHTNYCGAVSVLVPVVQKLRQQGHGTIVVLSSVAAERARKSNFVYGSSKAGLDAFAQGLGDSLAGSGVDVMVVRPGFVKTKMTAGLKPVPFSTTPDKVADATVKGLRRGSHTVWVPSILRLVMMAVHHIPRPVFRKLNW